MERWAGHDIEKNAYDPVSQRGIQDASHPQLHHQQQQHQQHQARDGVRQHANASPSKAQVPFDADITMEDADADPFDSQKYTYDSSRRSSHRSRPTSQYNAHEESSAARRYSPMTMSPASPYGAAPPSSVVPSQPNHYAAYTPSQSNRASPTRPSLLSHHSHSFHATSTSSTSPPSASGMPSPAHAKLESAMDRMLTLNDTGSRGNQLPPLQSALSPDQSPYTLRPTGHQSVPSFARELGSPLASQSATASPMPQTSAVPKFTRVAHVNDLAPKTHVQPPFRRANPEGGFISPLQALTTYLPATYRICNPGFKYESSRNPRRVLTKPSKGCKNDGYDNEDSDYILYVNDILGSEDTGHKNRYLILDVLGQGTFGQVVKCQNLKTQEVVAVKVVKNKTAYFNQSMMEVSVLDLLNSKLDKNDDHHLLRLKDTFIHRQHLCLVFELLSVNLYELIKQNQFRGLSTTLVRVFAQQLLNGLSLLNKARIIHCDLKPENILLKNLESPIIKIIDFGSACDERQTVYTYIQSRFYRSPEVLLGLPYSAAIDMWSLGCIVVELFLGLPLFPGSSEYNQVSRITEMLGQPPTWMLEVGKQSGEFFEKTHDEFGRRTYRLKSMEQYSREHNTKEQPSKKYFNATTLTDIIKTYPLPRKNMKQAEIDREIANRNAFIDFVRGLLTINPLERWSPQQAKLHPFITQTKFSGPFVPPMNLKQGSLNKSPAPGVQQQQQAEAMSKQRAQQQAAAQIQAQNSAMAAMQQQMSPYPQTPTVQVHSPGAYGPMYGTPYSGAPPPPYPTGQPVYGQQMGMMHPPPGPAQMQYGAQPSLHAQATARAGRQRASTMDQQQGGIPPTLQRVVSHLDPNQPIRLQPSPAYYPPPGEFPNAADVTPGSSRRRASRAGGYGQGQQRNHDLVRNLEDRSVEEAYGDMMGGTQPWH